RSHGIPGRVRRLRPTKIEKPFNSREQYMNRTFRAVAAFACIAAAFPALAQQNNNNPLVTRLEAHKVVRAADGTEKLAPAESARPGDVIEYVATYRNTGKQPIRNLEATLPIPHDT